MDNSSRRLTPELLLSAYRRGYFPMADGRTGPIAWYSPDPRAIIPLDSFHVPRSLRRMVTRGNYEIRTDTSFRDVIVACGEREETWISPEIVEAYVALSLLGYGHSVEVWQQGALAGGLYGIAIGGAFFGESMFSRVSGASKVALVHLVRHLVSRGFLLLDSQFTNPHLVQFGVREITRRDYLRVLELALGEETSF
jgi:leucyl/phenylalanyl-tRNA---protein transferase